jgi:diguanylate cyclase (GGDEF)-like protein
MPVFTNDECDMIEKHADSYLEGLKKNIVVKLQAQIGYKLPSELDSVLARLSALITLLKKRNSAGGGRSEAAIKDDHAISDEFAPLIKRVILQQRRIVASKLEEPLSKTFHPELIGNLEKELEPIRKLMEAPWFLEAAALRVPHLTEFLAIKFVEEMDKSSAVLERRDYDEKFHILQTPSLFHKDLRYFREKCELRSNGLMVAYLDVDDFKSFNTRYTETKVDRDLLPRFMELMETHLYTHGFGYRYGGDEYIMLLPNMSLNMGVGFIKEFQQKLRMIGYRGIAEKVTVSIGALFVGADCFLTEREIEDRANRAKNFAKKNGKNCIATYKGGYYAESELVIVK